MNCYEMTPQEVQEWCDKQPDYPEFKRECKEAREKFCAEKGITLNELESMIGGWHDCTK